MEKEYVDNDVFKYNISLRRDFAYDEITIYTKPFPNPIFINEDDFEKECQRQENLVQEKYFTQQKIDELKLKLIQRIQECKNPFYIACVDRDGGYNVTEDQLFNLD